MKVIIAGGRDLKPKKKYWISIDDYHEAIGPITEVVSGGARGADRMGEDWALMRGIPVKHFPADWATFGRSAGPIRNREMAAYADALIAFPGGRGTNSMIIEAKKAALRITDMRDFDFPMPPDGVIQ